MNTPSKIERFEQNVVAKYTIYNSVFMTLPFDAIDNTAALLPLFTEACESGFKNAWNPEQIIDNFSERFLSNISEHERIGLMFRFIQYIERQVVLFDAVEDAAFPIVNSLEGRGSLRDIKDTAEAVNRIPELRAFLESFTVRTVLTAHPTQFYPGAVLGIIADLTIALRNNDLISIRQLLSQLGKTPFIKKEKTSPYDEAVSLIWYLENIFYNTAGDMVHYINKNIFQEQPAGGPIVSFGFWPGGDRDGNPFVTSDITLQVAERLRTSVMKCYYREVRSLKRKLTFSGVERLITEVELKLYNAIYYPNNAKDVSVTEFENTLAEIRALLVSQHQSLYLEDVNILIARIKLFGFFFATLDIRQNSKIHDEIFERLCDSGNISSTLLPDNYGDMGPGEKIHVLESIQAELKPEDFDDDLVRNALESVYAMREIQKSNGEAGCNRYIISNNESATHVMQVYAMLRLCGWERPAVDIIPLFEVITDLQKAEQVMEELYSNKAYREHLRRRGGRQTVMLGFSDGTKDGGYLMANWSIYKAKMAITDVSRKNGIEVVFFDGRGGPPARGGGKTHKFYASLGPEIENHEIQVTIQGQTISSNFGTYDSCRYNLENLLSAGVINTLFDDGQTALTSSDIALMDELAELSYNSYISLKQHPKFVPYLEKMSTLNYFAKANIGSRPVKRGNATKLDLSDLRAIPFVGSWSQLKQNVPGFFGVGSALAHFETSGRWDEISSLYHRSLFFRTLLENSMMSLAKSFMPLTAYMKDDVEFGNFWNIINNEFELSKQLLLRIAGHGQLMENYPDGRASILMREHIVLPLLTIQQYALLRIRQIESNELPDSDLLVIYQKLVTRSLFGNTNAARNSA